MAAAARRLAALRVDHLVYAVPGNEEGVLERACAEFARLTVRSSRSHEVNAHHLHRPSSGRLRTGVVAWTAT